MTYRRPAHRVALDIAAVTDVGRCRNTNEDAVIITDLACRIALAPPTRVGHLAGAGFVLGVYDGCGHGPDRFPGTIAATALHERMCAVPVAADAEELERNLGEAMAAGASARRSASAAYGCRWRAVTVYVAM